MAASLDMVREILVRVKDVTTLFRCATVCKAWRRLLVADGSSFIRRCLPEDDCRSSPFRSFFTHRRSYRRYPPRAPFFVPAARPLLGNGCRHLSPFVSCVPAHYFDDAVPLVSRHGLLLVRLRAGADQDRTGVLMAVCDLLAGTVHDLPRLEHYWDFEEGSRVSGYALLTAADLSSSNDDDDHKDHTPRRRSRRFKVLIVTIRHRLVSYHRFEKNRLVSYDLHMFSSAEEPAGWNTSSGVVKDDEGQGIDAMLRQHNAVVLGGAARWLLWGKDGAYTLDVLAKTGHVSSTKMLGVRSHDSSRSKFYDNPYLTIDGEGNLTLLGLKRDGRRLEISTSYDNGRSFHSSMLELKQPGQEANGTNHGEAYRCLGEMFGMMLVKVNHRSVYIANVKTGVMWEVPDWPRSNGLCRRKIVPFQIDWPAFFASRLAAAR